MKKESSRWQIKHDKKQSAFPLLNYVCKVRIYSPSAARSNIEKVAIINFWQANGKFTNYRNTLYYDGKKVI